MSKIFIFYVHHRQSTMFLIGCRQRRRFFPIVNFRFLDSGVHFAPSYTHDVTDILLKVALNTINQTNFIPWPNFTIFAHFQVFSAVIIMLCILDNNIYIDDVAFKMSGFYFYLFKHCTDLDCWEFSSYLVVHL